MKIMTLNVWYGKLEAVLTKHLRGLDLDFACVQESIDFDGRSSNMITSYKTISSALGTDNNFFTALYGIDFTHKKMDFGNSIHSKHFLASQKSVFTRGEYIADFNSEKDDYNIRAFQHVIVDTKYGALNIINNHGHHINEHKMGDDETLRQVDMIINYADSLDGPIILCGDFNLSPKSLSIEKLNSKFRNLSVENHLDTTRSALTTKNEVCDYIFVNDQIKVNDFYMDKTIISDHNALILDFDINK